MGSCGQAGDIVVLQRTDCSNVNAITPTAYTIGASHSAKIVLEDISLGYDSTPGASSIKAEMGGAALVKSLAAGKVNELGTGIYKICYATKNSEGDDANDFKMLAQTVEILPSTATRPKMTVPQSALLGADISINWESTINLQTKNQEPNSWIGLFKNGTCNDNTEWAHECYVAYQFIEGGVSSGVVRFSQKDYKYGGSYDVRFFQGDSRNKQGRVCRGLSKHNSETYVLCVLEAALISSPITVYAGTNQLDDLDAIPGMEVMFDGNRGRFK